MIYCQEIRIFDPNLLIVKQGVGTNLLEMNRGVDELSFTLLAGCALYKMHLSYLEDPGKARGCYTSTVVISLQTTTFAINIVEKEIICEGVAIGCRAIYFLLTIKHPKNVPKTIRLPKITLKSYKS